MSWPSAGHNRRLLSESHVNELRTQVRPTSLFGVKEKFAESNASAILALAWARDAVTAEILRNDIQRRPVGQGDVLYLYFSVWAVFQIETDRAIGFLVQTCSRNDAAGVSARRCLERLAFRTTSSSAIERGPPAISEEWTQWAAENGAESWDTRFRRELAELLPADFPNPVTPVRDEDLAIAWDSFLLPGYSTYRLDRQPEITKRELVLMRISEVLAERHPDSDVSPFGFPLGYADSSWKQWSSGNRDLISWQTYLKQRE